jgi:hypothetical protein
MLLCLEEGMWDRKRNEPIFLQCLGNKKKLAAGVRMSSGMGSILAFYVEALDDLLQKGLSNDMN